MVGEDTKKKTRKRILSNRTKHQKSQYQRVGDENFLSYPSLVRDKRRTMKRVPKGRRLDKGHSSHINTPGTMG